MNVDRLARTKVLVRMRGQAACDWFAEQLVKELGADAAREKTCGPMLAAVERVLRSRKEQQNG